MSELNCEFCGTRYKGVGGIPDGKWLKEVEGNML